MNHLGRDTPITIGERRLTLSRYTRQILFEVLSYLSSKLPDPWEMTEGRLDALPASVGNLIVSKVIEAHKQRQSMYNPSLVDLWVSLEGRVKELSLLLGKYHPELAEQAEELYIAACLEHGNNYLPTKFIDCTGRMPFDETEADRRVLAEWGKLPALPKSNTPIETEDWLSVDRLLIKHLHLRPADIWELTYTEILVLLTSLPEKDEKQTNLHLIEINRAYNQLTPSEKWTLARQTTN